MAFPSSKSLPREGRPSAYISSPHIRESKTVLDSGFQAMDFGFQELDSNR